MKQVPIAKMCLQPTSLWLFLALLSLAHALDQFKQSSLLTASHRTTVRKNDPSSSISDPVPSPPIPSSSSTLRALPDEIGLSQSWGGVYGTNTINPETMRSSATEAHSKASASGEGIGLMPAIPATENHPSPLRPVGLSFNIEATMKIHDPIQRDTLSAFTPEMNTYLPQYRFDVVERNNTILFYGQDQDDQGIAPALNNQDLVRLINSIDTLTLNYYNALCYCRFENVAEFLTCRCEHSNDPWAPPPIPLHVIHGPTSHHDQMNELIQSSLAVARKTNNMPLLSVLKEAQDAASKSIHAYNIKTPDLIETEHLIQTLRDALFYTLKQNSTAASDDISSALHLVMSFHCSDHAVSAVVPSSDEASVDSVLLEKLVGKVVGKDQPSAAATSGGAPVVQAPVVQSVPVAQDPYNMTGKVTVDDTTLPVTKALSMLTKAVESHGTSKELTKLITLALERAEDLNTRDPLLETHLKACASIIHQESDSEAEARRKKREEEMHKKKMRQANEEKSKEEATKKKQEEVTKGRSEEMNKMESSIQLRATSKRWEQCYKLGKCTFGTLLPSEADKKALRFKAIPQHLPPTVDYGARANGTQCELNCANAAYGNYTTCVAGCKLEQCVIDRRKAIDQQQDILIQIEQVQKELSRISNKERNNELNPLHKGSRPNGTKLMGAPFLKTLQAQLDALQRAKEAAVLSENVAMACAGKWTHKKQVIGEKYRLEMVRQKHLHSRRTFMKDELMHLEDDALAARLASAREALNVVESEYKKMTGEALSDSYGDTAAALCFHQKSMERNNLNKKLEQVNDNVVIVKHKLDLCRSDRTKCDDGVDLIYTDLLDEQKNLRKEWNKHSECVTQHECAVVKLKSLKEEKRNLTIEINMHREDHQEGVATSMMLGDIPPSLIPHPHAIRGSLFHKDSIKVPPKPNGGYSSEDRSLLAYYVDEKNTCDQESSHQVEFTLLSGGMHTSPGSSKCVEYDNCFMDDDQINVHVTCNGTSIDQQWKSGPPLFNTSLYIPPSEVDDEEEAEESVEDTETVEEEETPTDTANPDSDYTPENGRTQEERFGTLFLELTNTQLKREFLSRTSMVWNQNTDLSYSNSSQQCQLTVSTGGTSRNNQAKTPQRIIGTYNVHLASGEHAVHVEGSQCGAGMSVGCGWITYALKNPCHDAQTWLQKHSLQMKEEQVHTDGSAVDGTDLNGTVGGVRERDGAAIALLEKEAGIFKNAVSTFKKNVEKTVEKAKQVTQKVVNVGKTAVEKLIEKHSGTEVNTGKEVNTGQALPVVAAVVAPTVVATPVIEPEPVVIDNHWRERKMEMIDRDIAQVEAWTNSTTLRYHDEVLKMESGDSAASASSLNNDHSDSRFRSTPLDATVEEAELVGTQERASRVVRCLNLARGTEVFQVLEKSLLSIGALDITSDHGITSTGVLDNTCKRARDGIDIARELGLATVTSMLETAETTGSVLHSAMFAKRLYEASQVDTLSTLFLEQSASTTGKSVGVSSRHASSRHPTNYDKVQWELSELTDMLRESGVRDDATSTTRTSLKKMSPETYSLVVIRDRLRSTLNRGTSGTSSSLERFQSTSSQSQMSTEVNMAMTALHDATRIPYQEFAALVNATLSCLCYPSTNQQSYNANENDGGSCGPTPDSYPVKKKYLLSPVFPMVKLLPTRNEVAERVQREMEARVMATRQAAEEAVKIMDKEARRRARLTSEEMLNTIHDLRIEKAKLIQERKSHEELLKSSIHDSLQSMQQKHHKMNATLVKVMAERTKLQEQAEEEDNKLEEKRKQHMNYMNKMRRSEMKLEDDLRLQNLEDEEKWRKEENHLDDIYMTEKKRREELKINTDVTGENYRLKMLHDEKDLRLKYNSELNSLNNEEKNIETTTESKKEHDLTSDKGHRLRGSRAKLSGRSSHGQDVQYQAEEEQGNVRGGSTTVKTRFPEYWKYGSKSRHSKLGGGEDGNRHFEVRPYGCYKMDTEGNAAKLETFQKEIHIATNALQQAKLNGRKLKDRIIKMKNIAAQNTSAAAVEQAEAASIEEERELLQQKDREHQLAMEVLRVQSKMSKLENEQAVATADLSSSSSSSSASSSTVLPFSAQVPQNDPMTPELCAAVCFNFNHNFTFAGIRNAKECTCGATPPTSTLVSEEFCPIGCPGDKTTRCGSSHSFVSVYAYHPTNFPAGMTPSEIAEEAEAADCRDNMTHAKKLLDEARSEVDEERKKWEEAVVRLARPKTCKQLLGLATGGGSGKYTIFPPEHTTFGESCTNPEDQSQYSDECAKMFKGVETYCDMNVDGGGWTLIGYAKHANLQNALMMASDTEGNQDGSIFSPLTRSGSANLNSLWVVQASTEMSFTWNVPYDNGENVESTSDMKSYQKILKFNIPNPEDQSIAPEIRSAKTCEDDEFSPVSVSCLKGKCNLPKKMYTGTDTLGVCQGHAYGLVGLKKTVKSDGMCDWRVDADGGSEGSHTAFYIGIDGTKKCSGIVDNERPKTDENALVPTTVGIWVR